MIDDTAFFDRHPGIDLATVSDINLLLQSPFTLDEIARLSQYLDADTILSLKDSRPQIADLPHSYV